MNAALTAVCLLSTAVSLDPGLMKVKESAINVVSTAENSPAYGMPVRRLVNEEKFDQVTDKCKMCFEAARELPKIIFAVLLGTGIIERPK